MALSIKNLMAAILISISGFLSFTRILPAYEFVSALRDYIDIKSDLLKDRTEIFNKINNIKAKNDSRFNELQRLSLVVPEKKNLPEIISTVEAIVSQTGN